ncbi:MAG: glycerate kinase [Kocuria sp.]|nr:glycerate kinase [Kocuria sp.]
MPSLNSTAFIRRVLIAPSGFKESLTAEEVARAITSGVRRAIPGVRVRSIPIADGGEGTAHTLATATGGRIIKTTVTGPVGTPVASHWALLGGDAEGTAVIEMAAAAGLRLVPEDQRDPTLTTTRGVGELIVEALDSGASNVLVGCGDSGTSDGGLGALQALGVKVLDEKRTPIDKQGNVGLISAEHLDMSNLHPAISSGKAKITLALNPYNVLTGPNGVAHVFGPQKGATQKQVKQMASGFDKWAQILSRDCLRSAQHTDFALGPGTGASGGLGAGLAAIGAELSPRFEALLDSGLAGFNLDQLIRGADLVITAEGAIDFQTPYGKVPAEVARRASVQGVPVIGLAGTLGQGSDAVHRIGIDAISSIIPVPMSLSEAVRDGEDLLTAATERFMRTLLLGASLAEARIIGDDW